MNPSHSQTVLLVAGMHRSGTSAITRILNLRGAEIGNNLLPPRADNPSGYWEDRSIVRCNDELLQAFDLTWRDPWPLPDNWEDGDNVVNWRKRLTAFLRQSFDDAPLILIKDPRLSRLLPAWKQVLAQMGVNPCLIVCVRNPLEVADSLCIRASITREMSLALWLVHTLEVERNSRTLPRLFVRYDDVLGNWRGVVQHIQDVFRIEWPRSATTFSGEVDAYLDASLRHHNAQAGGGEDLSEIGVLAKRGYALACLAASGEDSEERWDSLSLEVAAQLAKRRYMQPTRTSQPEPESGSRACEQRALGLWAPSELVAESLESRLYYRQGHNQTLEANHLSAIAQTRHHPMQVAFELPADAFVDFIRFDPATIPGIFRLHRIRIGDRELTREEIRISAVRQLRLAAKHGELLRFYSDDTDPYAEFDLRDISTNAGGLRIEFVFDCDPISEIIEHDLLQTRLDIRDQQMMFDASFAKLEKLSTQLDARMTQIEQLSTITLRRQNAASRYAQLTTHGSSTLSMSAPANRGLIAPWSRIALPICQTEQLRLHAGSTKAGDWWSSDENDPQLHLGLPPGRTLEPGWYVLGMRFAALDAHAGLPVLYLDYGDGFREEDSVKLGISPHGTRQRILLRVTSPVHALRLDPRDGPAEFLLSEMHMRRITAVEATLRLSLPRIRALRARGTKWRTLAAESWRMLRRSKFAGAAETMLANAALGVTSENARYAQWIDQYDTLTDAEGEVMREHVKSMGEPPLISVVMPVYNTPAELLRQCIDSVLNQIYPHWELCIANDASTAPEVRKVLNQYAMRDPRIKVIHRSENGHISAASNSALGLATGDWVALLDHDDELPEHALYHVAMTISEQPSAALIYSDEDKIDGHGNRFDPYFKPDWNPELFLGHNMFSHLGVYRRSLVNSVGGFREGWEGSQDYDLALRCIEQVNRNQILHIPHVLYHWRAVAGSTALAPGEKSYAHVAANSAISAHFERIGVEADVLPIENRAGNWRIRRKLPALPPNVSIIVPTRNGGEVLCRCIDSILTLTDYPNYDVLIVDNRSDDPITIDFLQGLHQHARCRVTAFDEPFNFSRLNNFAARQVSGDVLVFLNDDTEVINVDWLRELVSLAISSGVGAVGAMLYYPNDLIQHAGIVLGLGGDRIAGHAYHRMPRGYPGDKCRAHLAQEVSAVTAACMAVRRENFEVVGGFDESLAVAFNDVDLCLRLREHGLHNLWTPNAELYHHESLTRGADTAAVRRPEYLRECAIMRSRWGEWLRNDPYYHPALSLDQGDYMTYVEPRRYPLFTSEAKHESG